VTVAVPTYFGIVGVVHRQRLHMSRVVPLLPPNGLVHRHAPSKTDENYSSPRPEADRARRAQATRPQDKPVDGPSRGPCLAHRSPADASGLTRFACQTAD